MVFVGFLAKPRFSPSSSINARPQNHAKIPDRPRRRDPLKAIIQVGIDFKFLHIGKTIMPTPKPRLWRQPKLHRIVRNVAVTARDTFLELQVLRTLYKSIHERAQARVSRQLLFGVNDLDLLGALMPIRFQRLSFRHDAENNTT